MMKSLNPLQIDFLGIKLYINLDIEIITFVALDLKIYKFFTYGDIIINNNIPQNYFPGNNFCIFKHFMLLYNR